MTDREYHEKLERAHREARPDRPAARYCPRCKRHTGTRRLKYAPDECARCGERREL